MAGFKVVLITKLCGQSLGIQHAYAFPQTFNTERSESINFLIEQIGCDFIIVIISQSYVFMRPCNYTFLILDAAEKEPSKVPLGLSSMQEKKDKV
ncbi:predicted protein [Histoplasma mississippiense (nom. inval.)]|uniref:predicted protein n=1 Tax=Ajellomyces capsulatus (strain NAm1 / WU24) TaxID=2059318 RepID=UPI000157CAE5|nr:predicted protein [Histoplasma mississippiense (nom. inval.)]EDN09334.1 predicted protein [Histoplasma mississippiense (nom. inval.)]